MRCARVLVLAVVWTMQCFAQIQQEDRQDSQPMTQRPEEAQLYFFEAINLVAANSTFSRVDFFYKIDEAFLVAIKNNDTSVPFPFARRGEVLIELMDEKGNSEAREINRFVIGASSTEQAPDVKSWHEGTASFTVPPGEYSIIFEITDLESERHLLNRNRKVIAKQFSGSTIETSTPLFVSDGRTAGILEPVNLGGNTAFSKKAALFLQLHSTKLSNEPVSVEYFISTMEFLYEDPKVVLSDTILQLAPLPKSNPTMHKEKGTPRYLLDESSRAGTAAILIPLKMERLPLRPFTLNMKIRQGDSAVSIEHPFRMIWPEMPMSLRDVDFALEALRHITREDELDSLRSGSRETRLKHLEEFWKAKDRTPETEYNEMMVEYYRRVDYAARTFASMRGFDGYKSDRGRIYILYGPPTRSERTLDPLTGNKEIWTYEKQNKRFVFADQSKSGNYTLVATQNL